MKYFLLLTLLCCPLMADEAPIPPSKFNEDGHTTDKLSDVKKRVEDKKAILLDVREEDEWEDGHLKHAKLMPLSVVKTGKFTKEQEKLLPKGKPIYVHCAAGGRVLQVSKLLRQKGYDIRPLQDGYDKLLKQGFEKAVEAPKK